MTQKQGKIDFLAIGDPVIDAFIELQDASVHCDINSENCTISMRWGDKIPYKDVVVVNAVGNSANAAVSASRLGLNAGFMGWLGDDQNGKDCLKSFEDDKVDTRYVTSEQGKKTNYHYVLRFEAERTILVKHDKFSYKLPSDIEAPSWVYLSSLAESSLDFHDEIALWLEKNPDIKLAFQPGTFQIKMGRERLKKLYDRCELFFCNKEEAQRILDTKENDIKNLLKEMLSIGPKIVVITDGPNGSYTYDGKEVWHMPMYPDIAPPVDRTGAGDAFSSTFTVAIALGKSIPEALAWGPINSMAVVQEIGAQKGLLSREKLEEYLKNAPEDYKASKLA